MKIRPLREDDLAAAAAVVGKAIHPAVEQLAIEEWRAAFDPLAERHIRLQRDWVAEDHRAIAGVIGLYACKTIPKHVCYINWFSVNPMKQRQGIGSRLLAHAEREARRRGIRTLLVESYQPHGEAGLRFYRVHGFRRVGLVKDYWKEGFDLILLAKRL